MSQGKSSRDDAAMLGFALSAIGGVLCLLAAMVMSFFA